MRNLQIAFRFAGMLFAWFCLLMVLCFISLLSWRYIACLLIAIAVVILYSIQPKVLCRNPFIIRLAFILYLSVIVGFIAVSFFVVSHLDMGPVLLGGTDAIGSSRYWGIGIAIFMTLCAISGPVGLFLYKRKNKENRG
jgi:hypothetical protein